MRYDQLMGRGGGVGRAGGWRAFGSVLLSVALGIAVACGGEDEEDGGEDGPDEDAERYGCVFESRLLDTCNNPEGSPWVEGCVDVLTDEDCMLATEEMSEEVGDCTFTTTYRNVETTPDAMCPEPETGESDGPGEIEPAEAGEPCATLAECASGLCVPRFYCTLSCSDATECEDDFAGGCCVGEGSLGYCLAEDDCADLCPENSTPMGLPTICVCDDGFVYDPMTDACVAE